MMPSLSQQQQQQQQRRGTRPCQSARCDKRVVLLFSLLVLFSCSSFTVGSTSVPRLRRSNVEQQDFPAVADDLDSESNSFLVVAENKKADETTVVSTTAQQQELQRQLENQPSSGNLRAPSSATTSDADEDETEQSSSSTNNSTVKHFNFTAPQRKHARVLFGIFTYDKDTEVHCRNKTRTLFALDSKRICSLDQFKTSLKVRATCELVYTFVAGANTSTDAQTMLLENRTDNQITINKPVVATTQDFNDPDMTLLNIRENMNDGKSETWLAYAALEMEQYGIDYAVKTDTDTMVHLDKYFNYAHVNLPPAPFNTNVLAGFMANKWWWYPELNDEKFETKERAFKDKFGDDILHFYAQGQWYLLSLDLAKAVVQQSLQKPHSPFLEHHEDHDISARAFVSPTYGKPLHILPITLQDKFWRHPVKYSLGQRAFHNIWKKEIDRVSPLIQAAAAAAIE